MAREEGRRPRSPYSVDRPNAVLKTTLQRLSACMGWDSDCFFDNRGNPTGWGLDDLPDQGDVRDFFVEYLRRQLMSKFDDGKSSSNKKKTALLKFHEAEERCRITNERLRRRDVQVLPFTSGHAILHRMSVKIAALLGDFDWNEAESGAGFGPGSTTSLRWDDATLLRKWSGKPDCIRKMRPLVGALCARYPGRVRLSGISKPRYVVGNRITTVPKNYKTDRTIAIEPDLGMYFQKGIGKMIRRRLKKRGIDLDDQARNQSLARRGSVDGLLSTIDLSMASDTIAYALVEAVLPPDWFAALEIVRSHYGVLPCGTIHRFHKFSSMGNGYTFELESLIFWAICSSVLEVIESRDRTVGVYGDDLIVPTQSVPAVLAVLEWLGFLPNQKKTHYTGRFRESCGGHYLRGVDVTPFFIRQTLSDVSEVFLLHNNISRWCSRVLPGWRWTGPDGNIPDLVMDWLKLQVASHERVLIPEGVGDVGDRKSVV